MDMINIIISIISGIAVCIPLAVKLVQYVRAAVQERNWSAMVSLVLQLMQQAEQDYKTGAERKQYVMDSIVAVQDTLNFSVDLAVVSQMIDAICAASKVINGGNA